MRFFKIVFLFFNPRFSHWENFNKIILYVFKGQGEVRRGNVFIEGWLYMLYLGKREILIQTFLLITINFVGMHVEDQEIAWPNFNKNVIPRCESRKFNLINYEIIFVQYTLGILCEQRNLQNLI